MKVLYIINEFGHGGRERRLAQLVNGLSGRPDIEMMAAVNSSKIEYREIENCSLSLYVMRIGSLQTRINELHKVIKQFRPDIIHLWIETAMFCVFVPWFARKYGGKYIAGFVADGNTLKKHPFYQRLCIKHTFRKADAIVSNSRAGLVAKGAPMGKSHVIYNGFDKGRIKQIDPIKKREELGIPTKYLVTMCGRVEAAKDWNMFVELAEKTAAVRDDVYFLAVGGGNQLEEFRAVVKQKNLNNICFIGRRSDVEEILSATDVCLLFTNNEKHAEGVSNSIMEAMAAGVPVIATAGGGTAEIIASGEDGYVVPPKETEIAFSHLTLLLNDETLRNGMAEKAKQTIEERFDLKAMADQYVELYKKLLV